MSLEYEIRDNTLLWVKNPFTGVISYALDLRGKSFTYTLKNFAQRQSKSISEELTPEKRREAAANCPFCPGNEDRCPAEIMRVTPEELPSWQGASSGRGDEWIIRVINNLFPRIPPELTGNRNESYIIIEDPRHFSNEATHLDDLLYTGILGEEHFCSIMRVASQLVERALMNPAVGSVVVRKNQGPESGASQPHIHQQVIGSPGLLPALEIEARATERNAEVWLELINLAYKLDVIIEDKDSVVSYLSPTGLFPQSFDIVMPHFHGAMNALSERELRIFAGALYHILKYLGPLPLDYEIHQGANLPLHAHVNVRLFPYSNVAGTLNVPNHLAELAARVRRKLANNCVG